MRVSKLKMTGLAVLMTAFAAGSAYAGDGKDCDHKKTAAVKTQTAIIATPQVTVLSDADTKDAMKTTSKKVYSFEDALKLCQKKGVTDLQACVDYKTGVTSNKS